MGRQSVRFAPRPQAQASTICNVTAPVSLSMVLLPQVAAIAHLLAGLCPTSHSRRCGVGAQRPKAAHGHPQKVMRPSRCCREAEGAGQKGGAGVPSDPTRKGHFWRVRGGPPGARDQALAGSRTACLRMLWAVIGWPWRQRADQADDVLAVAYGGAATGLGPHHGQRHR